MRRTSAALGLAIACSGAPKHPAPPPQRATCPALAVPTGDVAYGIVVGASGAPISGAHVRGTRFAYLHGTWKASPSGEVTTAADGTYELILASPDTLEIEHAGRRVVWLHADNAGAPRRIDAVIDERRPPGILGVFDTRSSATTRCDWQCPAGEPSDRWWTQPDACPPGAAVRFEAGTATVIAKCVTPDGTVHGAFTSWELPAEHADWKITRTWFVHGDRCGT